MLHVWVLDNRYYSDDPKKRANGDFLEQKMPRHKKAAKLAKQAKHTGDAIRVTKQDADPEQRPILPSHIKGTVPKSELFDASSAESASENEELKINDTYAKRYQHNKEREERMRRT